MRAVWLAMLVYAVVVGALSLNRFAEGLCSTFDLGIHDQAVWLVYQGVNPFLTSRGLQVQADHFSPMAYLLAPLYFLWDDPRALLVFQTVWLASGALPVYGLARKHLRSAGLAQAAAVLYLCQPCLMFANFFDFHFSTLLSTPLLWACYALEYQQRHAYYAALLTALCCSETAPMSLLGLIPLAYLKSGWKRALVTALLAGGGLALSLSVIRWHNHGQATQYTNLYAHYGSSGAQVVSRVLLHPWDAWTQLNTSLNRKYLLQMLGPVAFLPVLGPLEMLPAAPVLAGNLLSWRESQHTIKFHYMAGILPFLMWAMVVGLARLEKRQSPRRLGWLLVISCFVGLLVGPLHPEEWTDFQPQRRQALADLQRLLPKDASLMLENTLGGPFSHRRFAYLFPNPVQQAAWGSRRQALVDQTCLGLDPAQPGAWRRALQRAPVDYIVSEPGVLGDFPTLRPDRAYMLGETCACSSYSLVYAANGVVVFARARGQGRRRPPRVLPASDWHAWQDHLLYY
ncbi:DUF2079 domain-containing protein [bacterium]|nr:DUF2079 domain-containing protein [bacterium]